MISTIGETGFGRVAFGRVMVAGLLVPGLLYAVAVFLVGETPLVNLLFVAVVDGLCLDKSTCIDL
jgi:hypothetical protein